MKIRRQIIVGSVVLMACSGCVQTRAYLMEKERVDQEVQGVPSPEVPKTRQIFVIEVIEKNQHLSASTEGSSIGTKDTSLDGQSKVVTEEKETIVVHESNFSFPQMTNETLTQSGDVKLVELPSEYKVEKDDTLQKISKKLYGSFNQWTKIYDANKDVIKDPNFLKPGVLLKIPASE